MPIANLDPIAELPVTPVLPETEKTSYLGIVADASKEPTGALVAYLDGMPWSVDYFGQLLGKHNDLRSLDAGQNAAFQQYQLTKGVELRVSTALSSSYDQERAITTVTGTAVLPYLLPNVNDYFIADAGSQQYGLYRVTRVERKIFNRDSVYSIDYERVAYVTPDTTLDECMALMTERHFRHLPVLNDDGSLAGMISIGDLVKETISDQRFLIAELERYIAG